MAFNSEPPTIQTPQHPVAYLCMAHHAFEAVSLIKGEPVRLQWVTYTAYILEL